ncbi:MAG: hypothetical protein AAGD92_14195 [Pseudomonadota bacterium]
MRNLKPKTPPAPWKLWVATVLSFFAFIFGGAAVNASTIELKLFFSMIWAAGFYAFVWILSNRFGSMRITKYILIFVALMMLIAILESAVSLLDRSA